MSMEERIPSELLIPPLSAPSSLPVETRLQRLPFKEIRWDDFERLCVRLVGLEADVEHCQRYGVSGQYQHGIDLYARHHGSGIYSVYQCKQRESLKQSDIRNAVSEFIEGPWAKNTATFILCVSTSVASTRLAMEIEAQAKRLAVMNIKFLVWDIDVLSEKLKDAPYLVDDFFGRAYVQAFCGREIAAAINNRLDASKVLEYRQKLRELYHSVFSLQDPGIPVPAKPEKSSIPFNERFVIPDVLNKSSEQWYPYQEDEPDEAQRLRLTQKAEDISEALLSRPETTPRQLYPSSLETYAPREPLDAWLVASDRDVIVGAPGSGKSATLRYLVLDLLSDKPLLNAVAPQWGDRLPIWIPFAFWTRLIADSGDSISLDECVRHLLKKYGREDLWSLMQKAIKDERALLVLDGLDESVDDEAGRIAAHLLQVYVETHKAAAVITSRPSGLHLLPSGSEAWRIGYLASFSAAQQRELVNKWVKIRINAQGEPSGGQQLDQMASAETDWIITDIGSAQTFRELANSPLMLSLLLFLHFQHASLPRHRFDAYEKLVEHLVTEHPAARRLTALIRQRPGQLTSEDVRCVLGHVAYVIQCDAPEGTISEERATEIILQALSGNDALSLGIPMNESKRLIKEFVPGLGEGPGLLIRITSKELGFLHRSIQEYLASQHLAHLPFQKQKEFVGEHGLETRWREVLIGFLWTATRPEDLELLLQELCPKVPGLDRELVSETYAEVAFGDYKRTPDFISCVAEKTFYEISYGERDGYRLRLLECMLGGLGDPRTRGPIIEKLKQWIFASGIYRPSLYGVLEEWPNDNLTRTILWRGLHDEDFGVQKAAASSLAAVATGHTETAEGLIELAFRSQLPSRRAAALLALVIGWPENPALDELISMARSSQSLNLRVTAIAARINLAQHNEDDMEELLRLADREAWIYELRHWRIGGLLATGWGGSPRLCETCLSSLRDQCVSSKGVERDVAIHALLLGFPQDDEVASWCAEEIDGTEFPFLALFGHDPWILLAQNFKDHPTVVAAIDSWGPKQKFSEPELAYAALVGRTPAMKKTLVQHLGTSSVPHWAADSLLAGWGMADAEVAQSLRGIIENDDEKASRIGHLIPRIITDKESALKRMLEILKSRQCRRKDFILMGLRDLKSQDNLEKIVTICLETLDQEVTDLLDPLSVLIEGFPEDKRVRELAIRRLKERQPPITAVVSGFPSDDDMRELVAALLTPLSASLRSWLAESLGRTPLDDSDVTKLLSSYDRDEDGHVKLLASIAYHNRIAAQDSDPAAELSYLEDTIGCYGPDYEDRRRAAFAGLLLLDRLGIMLQKKESTSDHRPVSISLRMFKPDASFMRLVAEHWDRLKSAFDSDVPGTLLRDKNAFARFWAELAAVAMEFPAVQSDVIAILESQPKIAWHPSALQFMSRFRQGSNALRNLCLSIITGETSTPVDINPEENRQAMHVAISILKNQFLEDDHVVQTLTERMPMMDEYGRIAALCRLWPSSKLIDELLARHKSEQYVPHDTHFALTYCRIPSRGLSQQLSRDFNWVSFHGPMTAQNLESPIQWLLRNDADAVSAFMDALNGSVVPSLKASIPRLLASATKIPGDLSDWCKEELTRQAALRSPELGYDIIARQVQGITISLFEVLRESSP